MQMQNQNQQQGQMHQNMHTGAVPPQMNHGGHEVFDLNEVLSAGVGTINQFVLLKEQVQDPELLDIVNRQHAFLIQEYNTTLESFKTGQDPAVPTQTYNMTQNNDFIYGLTPREPKKPFQSATEINDEYISGCLLHAHKSAASMKTMSALETTNPVVRRVLADSVPNCVEMAYELSIYQNKHHYYQVPQLAAQDMQTLTNAYAPATPGQMPMNNQMKH